MCMNILNYNIPLIKNFAINRTNCNPVSQNTSVPKFNTGVTNDVFIKSSPSFGSATSNGKFLMKLSRIRDPYSGVIILRPNEVDGISSALRKKQSTAGKLHIL